MKSSADVLFRAEKVVLGGVHLAIELEDAYVRTCSWTRSGMYWR